MAPRVIFTFARPDYELLCRMAGAAGPARHLWNCALREGTWQGRAVAIVAPAMGAPYATMVLEKLIVLEARLALVLGWCGSLQADVAIGDLVLPEAAVSADGTSGHYLATGADPKPDAALYGGLRRRLEETAVPWHTGRVWTTDAVFRETVGQVRHYQAQGVLVVDMEIAALFAVGQFRGLPVAGLLVVSDELASLTWRYDFRRPEFQQARELAARLVLDAAAAGETDHA